MIRPLQPYFERKTGPTKAMEAINDQLYAADAVTADKVAVLDAAKDAVASTGELMAVAESMYIDQIKGSGDKITDIAAKAKAKVMANTKYREDLVKSQLALIDARKAVALARREQEFLMREFDTLRKDADFERDAMARSPR